MKYLVVSIILNFSFNANSSAHNNYCSIVNLNDSDLYSFVVMKETETNEDSILNVIENDLSLDEAIVKVKNECARWSPYMQFDCEIEKKLDSDLYRVFRGSNYMSLSLPEDGALKVLAKLRDEGFCKRYY